MTTNNNRVKVEKVQLILKKEKMEKSVIKEKERLRMLIKMTTNNNRVKVQKVQLILKKERTEK